ncbi:MAG: hypothetical protein DMF24_07730 [Verrucomicrobia bacterium]|nr:MAG: hypothetical protein DMF24_07730 [Verrucomicrobiota bacterium]
MLSDHSWTARKGTSCDNSFEGNRIRITAELVNARDGFRIWSDTFEPELQGMFAGQDQITHAIVEALKVKLAVALPTRTPKTQRTCERLSVCFSAGWIRIRRLGGPGPA